MPKFAVTIKYMATHNYIIEAEDSAKAEAIGEDMSLDEPAHDHHLYDVISSRAHADSRVDNEDW